MSHHIAQMANGNAAPAMPTFTHFARMIDHGKGAVKTITILPLRGMNKEFDVKKGFVPVDPQDVDMLRSYCENGEPPQRGGHGRALFQVCTAREAAQIIQQETLRSALGGANGTPTHHSAAVVLANMGFEVNPLDPLAALAKVAAQPMAPVMPQVPQMPFQVPAQAPMPASQAPQVTVAPQAVAQPVGEAPGPRLGRRRGGKGSAPTGAAGG